MSIEDQECLESFGGDFFFLFQISQVTKQIGQPLEFFIELSYKNSIDLSTVPNYHTAVHGQTDI